MDNVFKTYSERILTASPVVMGLRLKPFTLGHSILLKRYKSSFMGGNMQGMNDGDLITELVFAALICSESYDEFNKEVASGRFAINAKNHIDWFCKMVGIKTKKQNKFQKWFNRVSKHFIQKPPFCLLTELQKFGEYLKAGTATPKYLDNTDSSKVSNCPFEFEETIKDLLMTEKGYTRNECHNVPNPEILSAFFLYAHYQGIISLQGEKEWKLTQILKGNK